MGLCSSALSSRFLKVVPDVLCDRLILIADRENHDIIYTDVSARTSVPAPVDEARAAEDPVCALVSIVAEADVVNAMKQATFHGDLTAFARRGPADTVSVQHTEECQHNHDHSTKYRQQERHHSAGMHRAMRRDVSSLRVSSKQIKR